jgi:hypothetical protein
MPAAFICNIYFMVNISKMAAVQVCNMKDDKILTVQHRALKCCMG